MANSLETKYHSYKRNNGGKEKVAVIFTRESIQAIQRYQKMKSFLSEQETIRFIVNAVLVREGLLQQS